MANKRYNKFAKFEDLDLKPFDKTTSNKGGENIPSSEPKESQVDETEDTSENNSNTNQKTKNNARSTIANRDNATTADSDGSINGVRGTGSLRNPGNRNNSKTKTSKQVKLDELQENTKYKKLFNLFEKDSFFEESNIVTFSIDEDLREEINKFVNIMKRINKGYNLLNLTNNLFLKFYHDNKELFKEIDKIVSKKNNKFS